MILTGYPGSVYNSLPSIFWLFCSLNQPVARLLLWWGFINIDADKVRYEHI